MTDHETERLAVRTLAQRIFADANVPVRWEALPEAAVAGYCERAIRYIALVDDIRRYSRPRPTGTDGCPAAPGAICCNRVNLCRPGGDA